MTLDEAIEILEGLNLTFNLPIPPKRNVAIALGIEALKRIIEYRQDDWSHSIRNLPGETIE